MMHSPNKIQEYQAKNKSIVLLINSFEKNYSELFLKVRTEWLPNIREFLREETGLKMHQKVVGAKIHKDTNISFQFVKDRENEFIKLIDTNYPDLNFEEYTVFKKLIIELRNSKSFFENNPHYSKEHYEHLTNYLEEYFKKYDLQILLKTLFINAGRTTDIWGTYFLNDSRIEIYYVPLILFCQINNCSLEHAILSTLVHEMAHAYHHLGKDKDNVIWSNMGSTDLKIVEGMAEYFTWLFIEQYKNNHRGMKETYNIMFDCLGADYKVFQYWTTEYSKEAIKSSLLGVRKKSVTKYNDFKEMLDKVKLLMP